MRPVIKLTLPHAFIKIPVQIPASIILVWATEEEANARHATDVIRTKIQPALKELK
jgi:hypothetical protein